MKNFAKETKKILEAEGLTAKQAQFIFDEVCKHNWKARKLKEIGAKWNHLNPHLLTAVIEQYNDAVVNLTTGEIISLKKENENED